MQDLLNKEIKITQIRSDCKMSKRQKACLSGLGLRKIGSTSTLQCSAATIGMLKSVAHVINVSNV